MDTEILRRAAGELVNRGFYMSIPARPDHDADLLLADAADEIDKLRARIAELEKDRERLDWLGYASSGGSNDAGQTREVAIFLSANGEERNNGEKYPPLDLRKTIDAAMAAEREG